jgi:hypothetical protein
VLEGPDAIVYFGGNAEDVSYNLPGFSEAFPHHALYLLHYRGYGGSSGSPSQDALFADGVALFDYARARHERIAVIGRSLGSAVAVHVASRRPADRLVLITPFDSLQDIAARTFGYLPVRWLLRDKFESWKEAPEVSARTLIVAAERDEIIPRESTELLRTRFRAGIAAYSTIQGAGHNTISDSADFLRLLRSGVE